MTPSTRSSTPDSHARPSWYFIARSDELHAGAAPLEVVAAEQLLSVWRASNGQAQARSHAAGIAVCERGPMVLAWLGGGRPHFEVEDFSSEGWLPMRWFHLDLPTRPEIVMRDLADIEHFETVHAYARINVEQALTCTGASCETTINFGWDAGVANLYFPARFWSRADGLGVQRTEVESLGGRLVSRHLVLPTPRLGGITRVHAGYTVKLPRSLTQRAAWLEAQALVAYLGNSYRRDLGRDAELWCGRSQHRHSDTPTMARYTRWLSQFSGSRDQPRLDAQDHEHRLLPQ